MAMGSSCTTKKSTVISTTSTITSTRFPFRNQSRKSRIGFNRGSVEARPFQVGINSLKKSQTKQNVSDEDSNSDSDISDDYDEVLNVTNTQIFKKVKPSKETSGIIFSGSRKKSSSFTEPNSIIRAAIPLISYWIMDHINSSSGLSCDEIPSVLARHLEDNMEMMEKEDFDRDIINSAEKMTALLVNLIKRQEQVENRVEPGYRDSVHGDDVERRRKRIRNQNFNKFSSERNVCGCQHRGECLQRSKTCFCHHGFTGRKCQKRVRKALMVGGLLGLQLRSDTELVGGLEVRRCSPPDYPLQVVAATGQTLGQDVVVCGGAIHDSKYLQISSFECSLSLK